MGYFETAAETYLDAQPPYPAAFFAELARRLVLDGGQRLLDLGCGPAPLALGFAPHAGALLGVDPEAAMLARARAAAEAAGVALALRQARAEELPADLGPFDVVCIGRARHWMERTRTLEVLERLIAPGGALLLCSSKVTDRNPWRPAYDEVRARWRAPTPGRQPRTAPPDWLAGSRFVIAETIRVAHRQPISIQALAARALAAASTSRGLLGARADAMVAELAGALAPHFAGGAVVEELEAVARVVRR